MFSLRIRILSLLVLLLAIAPAPSQESVAVLYGNDGNNLYAIDPQHGALRFIGRFRYPDNEPVWNGIQSIVFDGKQHKLYGVQYGAAVLFEIDTKTAAVKTIRLVGNFVPTFASLVYDPPRGLLYLVPVSTLGPTWLAVVNPVSGATGRFNQIFGGFPVQRPFFDNYGGFWICGGSGDGDETLQNWVPGADGRADDGGFRVSSISGEIRGPGDPERPWNWPAYQSFSCDPYTGVVWATFVSLDQRTTLCTVNLATGKPLRIIGTYTTPGWRLQITWGLSR